jgi:hypothetical protein
MTAPDPIREALEAAASSLRRPWPAFPTRGMTAEQQRQRAHEMAAAATIAAKRSPGLGDCPICVQSRWQNRVFSGPSCPHLSRSLEPQTKETLGNRGSGGRT